MSKSINFKNLKANFLSGISVAALSMPVGIAYAEMIGLPPESGVFTAIFALVCYFLMGTSKELILGPDSATVALLASMVISLAGDNSEMYFQYIALITVFTGILFFVAGYFKLGFIANFLSKPILTGFLNGIAGILVISQLPKFTGVQIEDTQSIVGLYEFITNISAIHFPTLIIGVSSLAIIYMFKKVSGKLPAQFFLILIAIAGTVILGLESFGIILNPEIESAVPQIIIPDVSLFKGDFSDILFGSMAIVFLSYTNQILTARSFSKDKNAVDPNKEFYAVGFADIVCGFFSGYPVCGSGSRTAVNINTGSTSKASGLLAAVSMLLVIIFFSKEFSLIPTAVFGAIIMDAALGIFNFKDMVEIKKFSKDEFYISLVCFAGVMFIGVLDGVLLAILLSFLMLIKKSSVPEESELVFNDKILRVEKRTIENENFIVEHLLIYSFNSAILFYNCNYFRERLFIRISERNDIKHVIVDASAVNYLDISGRNELIEIIKELTQKDITIKFVAATFGFEKKMKDELKNQNMDTDIFPNTFIQIQQLLDFKKAGK